LKPKVLKRGSSIFAFTPYCYYIGVDLWNLW
jgi:hypothetical protein